MQSRTQMFQQENRNSVGGGGREKEELCSEHRGRKSENTLWLGFFIHWCY